MRRDHRRRRGRGGASPLCRLRDRGRHPGRAVHANLLVGSAAHPVVLADAGMAADHGVRRPAGAHPAFGHAGCAGGGGAGPGHACKCAGGAAPGLRPDRAGERSLRAAGGVPACAAKCADSCPYGRRAAVRGAGRRRRDRRIRLLAPGAGTAGGQRDPVTGFPAGPGDCSRRRFHVCLPERGRRYRIRGPRSPHPLPVMTTISRTPPRAVAVPAVQPSRTILRRLRRRPLVVVAFTVLALFVILALAILAVLGPSLTNAMIAVGLSAVPVYARTARGTTLSVRAMDYVEAARAIGVGDGRILARHVLPNMISPVVVLATAGVGIAILIAAGLSYLGLGAQPPTPEWGAMLSQARAYLRNAWWMATFPGLAITLVVISLNLCGDWLRDLMDPRLRT